MFIRSTSLAHRRPKRELRNLFVKKHSALIIVGLLGLITMCCYWPITRHGFVALDDPKYVYLNDHIVHGMTWSGISWALSTGYASNWHPLTWISHMLDCQLYGLNPSGHHFTNIFLHAINAILLFLLVRSMTGSLWRSAFVSALFAWHPLHVESVAWAAERKDVLSTLFFLLTLAAYARYVHLKFRVERPEFRGAIGPAAQGSVFSEIVPRSAPDARQSTLFYWLALFCFALGLMSKPMLVTLPFVLLVIDFWPLNRLEMPAINLSSLKLQLPTLRSLAQEKVAFFALSAAACIVTYFVQKAGGAVSSLTTISMTGRLANAAVAYARYLSKTIWPVDLAVFYPLPDRWSAFAVTGSVALLLVLSALFIGCRRRFPYLIVGWLWFVGTLVPTIGLVQVGSQSMADRYMYIPSIGLFLMAVWGLPELADRLWGAMRLRNLSRRAKNPGPAFESLNQAAVCTEQPATAHEGNPSFSSIMQGSLPSGAIFRIVLSSAAAAPLMACLLCTSLQIGYWHDEETLFRHAMQVTSDNYLAYDHLAKVCENGRKEEAVSLYQALLHLKPQYPEGQYNFGTLLMEMGKLDEAVPHLKAALALRPKWAQAHSNFGITLIKQGKLSEAAEHLEAALQLNPQDPDAFVNLGVTRLAMNRAGDAALAFRQALLLDNEALDTQFLLALSLSRDKKLAEASVEAQKTRDLALAHGRQDVVAKANEILKACQPGTLVQKQL